MRWQLDMLDDFPPVRQGGGGMGSYRVDGVLYLCFFRRFPGRWVLSLWGRQPPPPPLEPRTPEPTTPPRVTRRYSDSP